MATKKKTSGSAKKQRRKTPHAEPKKHKSTRKRPTTERRATKKRPGKKQKKPARKAGGTTKPSGNRQSQSRRSKTTDQDGGASQKTTIHTPFHINAAQIASFPEEKFKEFVKALLRAERLSLGLPDGSVIFGDEMKASDGGVDLLTDFLAETIRKEQLPDRTLIPLGQTAWQLKAEKRAPGKSEFKKELKKPNVKRILSNGGSYVFLAQKPNTAPDQKEKQLLLKEVAQELGLPGERVYFYAQSGIEDFARRYPSLARAFGPGGRNYFGALLAGAEWSLKSAFETEFQDVADRAKQLRLIQDWLIAPPSPQRHIRIIGPPGVGKTRLVLEALRTIQALPLTVYAPGYTAIPPEFLSHFHESGLECILVIDECRDEELAQFLDNHGTILSKIRLITIGHFEDDIRRQFDAKSPLLIVTPLTEDAIGKVLAASRPTLQPNQRAWVAAKTGGFVKLAELLADALANQPEIDLYSIDAIATIASYLSRRLGGDRQRELLQSLSLFTRIGLHGEVRWQYEAVVDWVGISKIEADKTVKTAKEKNIFAEAGLFAYVTPQMLAAWLAGSLWKSSAESIIQFLSDPRYSELIELAAPRINKLSVLEPLQGQAANALSKLLSTQGPFRDLEALENPSLARAFCKLARANPSLASRWLYQHSSELSSEQLAKLRGGRREIMWLMPDLLWLPDAFDYAFRSLVCFARAENEPRYANNATGILGSIFLIHLAPTQVPFFHRIEQAQSIFPGADSETRRLLVEAVGNAFELQEFGLVMPSHMELPGWQPSSEEDEIVCRREALNFVENAIADKDSTVSECASQIIVTKFRSLSLAGLAQESLAVLRKLLVSKSFLPKARNSLESALAYDSERLPPSAVEQFKRTLTELPTDLLSRVRVVVGGWGIPLEDTRKKAGLSERDSPESLAKDILAEPERDEIIHALFEKPARNPGSLAYSLGELDESLSLWPLFLLAGESTGNAWLCSIYVGASLTINPHGLIRDWCVAALRLDNELHREIAARAMSIAPGTEENVLAMTEGLNSGKVRPDWIAGIIMGGWTKRAALPALEKLLASLVSLSSAASMSIALQATIQAIHGNVALSSDFLRDISVAAIEYLRGDIAWEWGQIATQVAERHPMQLGLAILEEVSNDSELNLSAREQLVEVFRKCLEEKGMELADIVLSKLVVDGKYDHYILNLVEGMLLEFVNIDQMIEWAYSRGDAGQVVLAKLLQPSPASETVKALTRFGAKSSLGQVLAAEYGSGSFYGDIAERDEELANQAKQWSEDSQLPPVFRQWAENVFLQQMESAKGWRERSRQEKLMKQLDNED